MPKARLENYNGSPAIMVDGVAYPPMTVMPCSMNEEYIKHLGEAGLRIFYVYAKMRWNCPGKDGQPDGVEETLANLEKVVKNVPDALVMLRLVVNPNVEWINAHQEEQVLFSDGSHNKVVCTSAGWDPVDGMVSFASEVWRKECEESIEDFLCELEKSPLYTEHVIGVFMCAGGTDEWYYPGPNNFENREKGIYADFSKPFRNSYSAYLKDKYKTEENLQRAWKRPDANFENPIIPNLHERKHCEIIDEEVEKGLYAWELAGRFIEDEKDEKGEVESNLGVFLNMNDCRYTMDFFDALHKATADTIIRFAKAIKKHSKDLLVGAFYGTYGCAHHYKGCVLTGVLNIMDSGVVDFLSSPGVYNNRELGGVIALRQVQDTYRLRNCMFINEDDSRTHLSLPKIQPDAMRLYTLKDSINTLKRDFARIICEDVQSWWLDMNEGDGPDWYDVSEILSLFKRQQEIGELAYSLDRAKKNEIALIYDLDSVLTVSHVTNNLVNDFFRTSDLARIGAPVDYYLHDDMARPDMPDYKLYVMLNVYNLTDAEREAIYAKARKNKATVLWLYAPGFINTDTEPLMDLSNIEKTVGMKVNMYDHTITPWFFIDPSTHEAVKYADPDRRYGYIDRDVHSCIWLTPTVLPTPCANPGFSIEEQDNITVLGRYGSDGAPALAMRDDMGFTSVYCCTQVVRSEIIASIAEYAGCHIYTQSDDVLFANNNFVAIHASYSGKRTITFPRQCSPYELYENRYYGENVTSIEVDLKLGDTLMFQMR